MPIIINGSQAELPDDGRGRRRSASSWPRLSRRGRASTGAGSSGASTSPMAGVPQTAPHLRIQKLWLLVALLPLPACRRTTPAWWLDLEGTARRLPVVVAEMPRWQRSPLRDTGAVGTESLSKE